MRKLRRLETNCVAILYLFLLSLLVIIQTIFLEFNIIFYSLLSLSVPSLKVGTVKY